MAVIHRGGIEIRKVVTGPYSNNCYVVVSPSTRESVIIDTPAEPDKVLAEAEGTEVKGILITHCHMDHILGHQELKAATKAPVWVHETEAGQLPLSPEHHFRHGGEVTFGSVSLKTLHVPGHTTGGTSLLWGDQLFSGDTLFPNGPGKTMSPDAFKQLVTGLEERIFVLPDGVAVHPGHGDGTSMGREKRQYETFKSKPHKEGLHGDVTWLEA